MMLQGWAQDWGVLLFIPLFQRMDFCIRHMRNLQVRKADFSYNDSIKVKLQWVLTEWKSKRYQRRFAYRHTQRAHAY